MKSVAIYVVAAVLTTTFSAVLVTWTVSESATDNLTADAPEFSWGDVRAAVDSTMLSYDEERLANLDPESSEMLGSVDRRIARLEKEQRELLAELKAVARAAANAPQAGGGEYVIPDEERILELVAMAVTQKREDEQRAREEREKNRAAEYKIERARRQVTDIAKALGMKNEQRAEHVASVMNRLYADSRDYLAQARRAGTNIDKAMMIDVIKRLEGEAEQNLRGYMNDDEYTRWGQYRQKSMWRDSRSLWRYVK